MGGAWTCGGKFCPCWHPSFLWRCSGQRSCMLCRDRAATDSERLVLLGQKSKLRITGHFPAFVLCFALRSAASHCALVQFLTRRSAKTVSATLNFPSVSQSKAENEARGVAGYKGQ